ncbi:MAG: FAD:protein FMN transferase [Bacteroidales bacterium]|nr:FAD:protein FMN transferase [Bacteroidales bacterium]
MKQKIYSAGLIIVMIVSLFACNSAKPDYYKYQGYIQGTTFSVIYEHNKDIAPEIDSLLKTFNQSLNNYDSTSLISRINRNETTNTDSLFERMFFVAEEVWIESDGRFDITIAPLANAWGFGYETGNLPDSAMVDSLLQIIGFDKLQLKNHEIIKQDPRMEIIGNAIAQGLSVDYLAEKLSDLGIENYLVEIGGEIYAQGINHKGTTWNVGIDKPIQDSMAVHRESLTQLSLSGKAIATSGNYRKYHMQNGQAVGHALNPKTGCSEKTDILSTTVIHETCVYADAWATAFMLMSSEQALSLAETLPGLELMLIIGSEHPEKNYEILYSSGFPETKNVIENE